MNNLTSKPMLPSDWAPCVFKEDKATYVVKPMFNSDYTEQYRNLTGAN